MTAPRVIYICGAGRSGSTLLELALASLRGVTSVGELRHIWRMGILAGGLCSCREPVLSCPRWQAVLAEAGVADPLGTAQRAVAVQTRHLRLRQAIRRSDFSTEPSSSELLWYANLVNRIYRAVAAIDGCDVIVDSSKHPADLRLHLTRSPEQFVPVHLVRSMSGVADSLASGKVQLGSLEQRPMSNAGWWKARVAWVGANVGSRWAVQTGGGSVVDFDTFCIMPGAVCKALADQLSVPMSLDHPLFSGRIPANTTHLAWGNPIRFDSDEDILIHLPKDRRLTQGRISAAFSSSVIRWCFSGELPSRMGRRQ